MRWHRHHWLALGVEHYELRRGGMLTLVKWRCDRCGKPKAEEIDGLWSLSEVSHA